MPGGGSQGWELIARDVSSSSHPRLLFMACGLHGVPEPEKEPQLARLLAVRTGHVPLPGNRRGRCHVRLPTGLTCTQTSDLPNVR